MIRKTRPPRAGGAPGKRGAGPAVRATRPAHSGAAEEKLGKIAGLSAVAAVFRREPERVVRLYYDDSMKTAAGPFCAVLARLRRPYRLLPPEEMARVAGTVLHGGIVAAVRPREVPDLTLETAQHWAKAGAATVLLDGVGNPHNLGAIARTLAFFGLGHLVLSDHPAQAGLSDAAYRVAEGGLEFLDVRRLTSAAQALRSLRPHFHVVGTALHARGIPPEAVPRDRRPILLVLGNEENGLPPPTLAACETVVTIPGGGQIQSLNVSATAAILTYSLLLRQAER
ncbi:TrmH family RNA methyltransferase [Methylococcus capsulatus]|uniref:TrmH family RNA methyltransferase n=1 Tax=Methylococcus capsulatus TaxID=414 RepID=UPI0002DE7185|nr:RNA methyltransferase [Methylococcus capsulatus]